LSDLFTSKAYFRPPGIERRRSISAVADIEFRRFHQTLSHIAVPGIHRIVLRAQRKLIPKAGIFPPSYSSCGPIFRRLPGVLRLLDGGGFG